MEWVLYGLVRAMIQAIACLPLTWVARLGRWAGALVYWLDPPHRRTAIENLQAAFRSGPLASQAKSLAREHFKRLGENYCCAIKTAFMSRESIRPHLEILGTECFNQTGPPTLSRIIAVGHFGNFELYARVGEAMPGFALATTYRDLKQPKLSKLMTELRSRSGCQFFERRRDFARLKQALTDQPMALGLLCDQHAGHGGLRIPFLGRLCSTSAAPALMALRYQLPLFVGICYRVAPARWRIVFSGPIPTTDQNKPRSLKAIMTDVNTEFEKAVLRDPANWFWVHNRWKPSKSASSSIATTAPSSNPISH